MLIFFLSKIEKILVYAQNLKKKRRLRKVMKYNLISFV